MRRVRIFGMFAGEENQEKGNQLVVAQRSSTVCCTVSTLPPRIESCAKGQNKSGADSDKVQGKVTSLRRKREPKTAPLFAYMLHPIDLLTCIFTCSSVDILRHWGADSEISPWTQGESVILA